MSAVDPRLDVSEVGGRVRITLAGLTQGEGTTLQAAADDLVPRVRLIATAFRSSGIGRVSSECPLDSALLDFVFEVGEVAARDGDIRPRVLGGEYQP